MGVLLAWAIAAGIQTTRDVRYLGRAPVPSEYVASGMLFGSLSILSSFAESLATALAWGFLFGMAVEAGGPHKLVTGGFPEPLAKWFSPGAPGVTPTIGTSGGGGFGTKATPYGPLAPATGARGGNRVSAQVLAAASSWSGTPYLFGGDSRGGIDCSGLTMESYRAAGITLPHNAAAQAVMCVPILRSSLSPGDLIFMPLGETHISHVAIYDGSGYVESAPSHGGVGSVPWGYQQPPYYYGRPVQAFLKPRKGSH